MAFSGELIVGIARGRFYGIFLMSKPYLSARVGARQPNEAAGQDDQPAP